MIEITRCPLRLPPIPETEAIAPIQSMALPSLIVLKKNPYSRCFIPLDSQISESKTLQIASKYINTFPKTDLEQKTHITHHNIINYCKNDSQNFDTPKMERIVTELRNHHFINDWPYSARLYGTAIQGTCDHILKISKESGQRGKFILLAQILFDQLDPLEKAKLKVIADFLCLFYKINEQLEIPFELDQTLSYEEQFKEILPWISSLENFSEIEHLDLSHRCIETFPKMIFSRLKNLKTLELRYGKHSSWALLTSIAQITSLEDLDLSHNEITKVPPSFFAELRNLKTLNLESNPIKETEKTRIQELCNELHITLIL